jgi:hypothetical protein
MMSFILLNGNFFHAQHFPVCDGARTHVREQQITAFFQRVTKKRLYTWSLCKKITF